MTSPQFSKMQVTLGNSSGEQLQLDYQIRHTKAAQAWANCIQQAEARGFRENNRFYNFPEQENGTVDALLNQLDEIILSLQKLHPELHMPLVDRLDLQSSLNNLHFNFAHSHNVTHKINDTNKKYWNDFNVVIHAIEGAVRNVESLKKTGLPLSRVVFTWNENKRLAIPDECYQDFVISYEFGCAYVNYAQVGRHFYEIYTSNDTQLADEHILPSRFISADTNLWFGPTNGHVFVQFMMEGMKNWFEIHKERFNTLGFHWGDPKLAIGHIPVARLTHSLHTMDEINGFVKNMARFSKVENVRVE